MEYIGSLINSRYYYASQLALLNKVDVGFDFFVVVVVLLCVCVCVFFF